jgi:hypothetical protein
MRGLVGISPVIESEDEWLWEYRFSGRSREDLLTEKWMRSELPYGMWSCADNREVLFNRYYRAIWQRYPGEAASLADRDEWVPCDDECHFYEDACVPWRRNKAARLMAAKLDEVLSFRSGTPIANKFVVSRGLPRRLRIRGEPHKG